jgi:hypothetical protein
VIATAIIFLLLGAGAGAVGMYYYAEEVKEYLSPKHTTAGAPEGTAKGQNPMAAMMMKKGGPGGKGGKGGAKGGGPKAQLIALLTKLDLLTEKALSIHLDSKQKVAVAAQLKELEEMKSVSDDEARKTLDTLLAILEEQKDALVGAGFPWPGVQAGPGGQAKMAKDATPNPFAQGPAQQHLEALRERLK